MAALDPNDPSDCVVIRAAARYTKGAGASDEEVEKYASGLASMITSGQLTLALREGPGPEGRHGAWLCATFAEGIETFIPIEHLNLPPGIVTFEND